MMSDITLLKEKQSSVWFIMNEVIKLKVIRCSMFIELAVNTSSRQQSLFLDVMLYYLYIDSGAECG